MEESVNKASELYDRSMQARLRGKKLVADSLLLRRKAQLDFDKLHQFIRLTTGDAAWR
ncbi:hypothetical protein [Spirosoma jeollabukense]